MREPDFHSGDADYATESGTEDKTLRDIRFESFLSILQDASKIRDQDISKFSDLVNKAKGPNRSMRQFAKDMGKNPTQLSRALNGQLKGGCPNDLLALIANYADQESGVTLEALMEANGQVPKKSLQAARMQRETEISALYAQTLSSELIRRGYTVTAIGSELFPGPVGRLCFDLTLVTDAVDRGTGRWVFEFKFSGNQELDGRRQIVGTGATRRLLAQIMANFYAGTIPADKVSIVVSHKALFEQLKEQLQGYRIPDLLSIILINTSTRTVTEEFTMQTTDDCPPKEVFFPVQDTLSAEDKGDWDTDDDTDYE